MLEARQMYHLTRMQLLYVAHHVDYLQKELLDISAKNLQMLRLRSLPTVKQVYTLNLTSEAKTCTLYRAHLNRSTTASWN